MVAINDPLIVEVLSDKSHIETPESSSLRVKALDLLNIEAASPDSSKLPDTLLELLAQVIKPLFSKRQHKNLTSTGRKNLVDEALPASVTRFGGLFNDDRPIWKNSWTSSLLQHMLSQYRNISDVTRRKKALEAHFHLLVPPILHQIDDIEIGYKCTGCRCLKALCEDLYGVRSGILRQSGLTDVFIDALKTDFSLLPTLTPEEDSLALFRDLYPAYLALVKAAFPSRRHDQTGRSQFSAHKGNAPTPAPIPPTTRADQDQRQAYLTTLLRHQLLYGLNHLSTGSGPGSTISVRLSTFLISQLQPIFIDMGIESVIHLQTVLPLLRNILSDPFATAVPNMLLETVHSLVTIVTVCSIRTREKWWREVLRGVVGCWLNAQDDLEDLNDDKTTKLLEEIRSELKMLTFLLDDVVGPEFRNTMEKLVEEDESLKQLAEGLSAVTLEMEVEKDGAQPTIEEV